MHLNEKELRDLQRFRLFVSNGFIILIFGVVWLVDYMDISNRTFHFSTALFVFIGFITTITKKTDPLTLIFPPLHKLRQFEKEKYGPSWKAQNYLQSGLQFILTIFISFNAYMSPPGEFDIFEGNMVYITYILFLFLLVLNVSMVVHNRKMAKANTIEFKSYSRKAIVWGIVIGLLFSLLVFFITFYMVIK